MDGDVFRKDDIHACGDRCVFEAEGGVGGGDAEGDNGGVEGGGRGGVREVGGGGF